MSAYAIVGSPPPDQPPSPLKRATVHKHDHSPGHDGCGEKDCAGGEAPRPIVTPGDVVELVPGMQDIYIVGTVDGFGKVTKITGLEPELTLRSCLIEKMENLETLTELERLELYDNQILTLADLTPFKKLRILDMSYNLIKSTAAAAACPLLEELYVAQNRLRSIEGLEGLTKLKKLDLGANRIRSMDGVQHCSALEELWLGKNKIEAITGLEHMPKLRRLDVQSNRLTEISGLQAVTELQELYLAHNAIARIEGLGALTQLSTLDVSSNRIASISGLESLGELTDLWMSSNGIATFEEVAKLGAVLPSLDCLYLEHNPIYRDFEYRKRIAQLLPKLTQLDATPVRR
ncbi:hypothetical protein JKP88DRAFT_202902 [Tribonema minus]|uniref:Protein phosphatase 1 regulatory subunit 7 n=1 Tax=Tribonema minus TaxID=303371 RepID=A0A836C9X2_9STRA|nr:hypothetical protein JKP88DRAFT_202902 [Tribonema minus]